MALLRRPPRRQCAGHRRSVGQRTRGRDQVLAYASDNRDENGCLQQLTASAYLAQGSDKDVVRQTQASSEEPQQPRKQACNPGNMAPAWTAFGVLGRSDATFNHAGRCALGDHTQRWLSIDFPRSIAIGHRRRCRQLDRHLGKVYLTQAFTTGCTTAVETSLTASKSQHWHRPGSVSRNRGRRGR